MEFIIIGKRPLRGLRAGGLLLLVVKLGLETYLKNFFLRIRQLRTRVLVLPLVRFPQFIAVINLNLGFWGARSLVENGIISPKNRGQGYAYPVVVRAKRGG